MSPHIVDSYPWIHLLNASEQAAAEKQLASHVPTELKAGKAIQLNAAPIEIIKKKKKKRKPLPNKELHENV